MAELYLSDADLNALGGTVDADHGLPYPTTGEDPHYTDVYKALRQLLVVGARAGELRIYKDGAATFGVRAGRFVNGDSLVNYAGATGQTVTEDATNYVYITAAGTLTKNTTGFPVPSVTPHIPLATIAAGTASQSAQAGFRHVDVTDYRGRGLWRILGAAAENLSLLDWQESVLDELDFTTSEPSSPSDGDRYLNTGTGDSSETTQAVTANRIYEWNGTSWTEITPTEGAVTVVEDRDMLIGFNGSAWVDIGTFALLAEAQTFFGATDLSGAEAETLSDGSNADGLHVHAVAGLAAAVQDLMPNLLLSAGAESSDERTITIQARDAANNALGERMLIRVWIATADFGAPDATGNTVAVDTGTTYETETANAAYKVISDATGKVEIGVTISGAATRYILAEIDGRIYSSGQIDWAA